MKTAFATTWNRSVQRRKQRKYVHNAPAHTKGKFLSVHLSTELKKQHNTSTRSMRVRKGDKVKVLRGMLKGREGIIDHVDINKSLVYIENVGIKKADGSTSMKGVSPSNLMITELLLDDKKRKSGLETQTKEK